MRVPLSDRACELIQDAIGNVLGDRFVFISPVTKRGYIPETVRKIWKKYSGSDVDMYSATRHSFCTQLVEMGMSEIEAQGIMRHKDARSTRSYFHPTQERQRDFLNRRGKVIPLKKATDVDEG
jgi:site-specific recombinase XerD